MKRIINIMRQFKQWILSIIIGYLMPDLDLVLTELLRDSKDWAIDWSRDYDKYDYVIKAKKILKLIKGK